MSMFDTFAMNDDRHVVYDAMLMPTSQSKTNAAYDQETSPKPFHTESINQTRTSLAQPPVNDELLDFFSPVMRPIPSGRPERDFFNDEDDEDDIFTPLISPALAPEHNEEGNDQFPLLTLPEAQQMPESATVAKKRSKTHAKGGRPSTQKKSSNVTNDQARVPSLTPTMLPPMHAPMSVPQFMQINLSQQITGNNGKLPFSPSVVPLDPSSQKRRKISKSMSEGSIHSPMLSPMLSPVMSPMMAPATPAAMMEMPMDKMQPRPRISPSLKPMVKGDKDTQRILTQGEVEQLASKSNYQNLLEGEGSALGLSDHPEIVLGVGQRRLTHKTAEQKRRDSLKQGYDLLETLLPSSVDQLSKVELLRKSYEHILFLQKKVLAYEEQLKNCGQVPVTVLPDPSVPTSLPTTPTPSGKPTPTPSPLSQATLTRVPRPAQSLQSQQQIQ